MTIRTRSDEVSITRAIDSIAIVVSMNPLQIERDDQTIEIFYTIVLDGFETDAVARFDRSYPRSVGYDLSSEWDTPRITVCAWDAHNGTLSWSVLAAAHSALLELNDYVVKTFCKEI